MQQCVSVQKLQCCTLLDNGMVMCSRCVQCCHARPRARHPLHAFPVVCYDESTSRKILTTVCLVAHAVQTSSGKTALSTPLHTFAMAYIPSAFSSQASCRLCRGYLLARCTAIGPGYVFRANCHLWSDTAADLHQRPLLQLAAVPSIWVVQSVCCRLCSASTGTGLQHAASWQHSHLLLGSAKHVLAAPAMPTTTNLEGLTCTAACAWSLHCCDAAGTWILQSPGSVTVACICCDE